MASTCAKAKDGRHMWRDVGTKDTGKDVRCMLCGAPQSPDTFGYTESPLKRT